MSAASTNPTASFTPYKIARAKNTNSNTADFRPTPAAAMVSGSYDSQQDDDAVAPAVGPVPSASWEDSLESASELDEDRKSEAEERQQKMLDSTTPTLVDEDEEYEEEDEEEMVSLEKEWLRRTNPLDSNNNSLGSMPVVQDQGTSAHLRRTPGASMYQSSVERSQAHRRTPGASAMHRSSNDTDGTAPTGESVGGGAASILGYSLTLSTPVGAPRPSGGLEYSDDEEQRPIPYPPASASKVLGSSSESRPPLPRQGSGNSGRDAYSYTPTSLSLSKNPHLQMGRTFSPHTIRLTESLDTILQDEEEDNVGLHREANSEVFHQQIKEAEATEDEPSGAEDWSSSYTFESNRSPGQVRRNRVSAKSSQKDKNDLLSKKTRNMGESIPSTNESEDSALPTNNSNGPKFEFNANHSNTFRKIQKPDNRGDESGGGAFQSFNRSNTTSTDTAESSDDRASPKPLNFSGAFVPPTKPTAGSYGHSKPSLLRPTTVTASSSFHPPGGGSQATAKEQPQPTAPITMPNEYNDRKHVFVHHLHHYGPPVQQVPQNQVFGGLGHHHQFMPPHQHPPGGMYGQPHMRDHDQAHFHPSNLAFGPNQFAVLPPPHGISPPMVPTMSGSPYSFEHPGYMHHPGQVQHAPNMPPPAMWPVQHSHSPMNQFVDENLSRANMGGGWGTPVDFGYQNGHGFGMPNPGMQHPMHNLSVSPIPPGWDRGGSPAFPMNDPNMPFMQQQQQQHRGESPNFAPPLQTQSWQQEPSTDSSAAGQADQLLLFNTAPTAKKQQPKRTEDESVDVLPPKNVDSRRVEKSRANQMNSEMVDKGRSQRKMDVIKNQKSPKGRKGGGRTDGTFEKPNQRKSGEEEGVASSAITKKSPKSKVSPKRKKNQPKDGPKSPKGSNNQKNSQGGAHIRSNDQSSNADTTDIRRAELVESPATRIAFKDFCRQFRAKERVSFLEAEQFARNSLEDGSLPTRVHWRVYLELADLAKRANKFDEARKLYENVCTTQPYACQGWLEYSKLEEECGNLRKCAQILHDGLDYCEYNENLLIRAIKHEEKMGHLNSARQFLGRLKHVGIEKVWRTLLEGALLEARAGNDKMARRVLKYLMHHVSWYGPLYSEAYSLERELGCPQEALLVVERGLKEIPRYGPLWFGAFRLCEGLDTSQKAYDLPLAMEFVNRATKSISRELIWKVHLDAALMQERAALNAVAENPNLSLDDMLILCRRTFAKTVMNCPPNLCWKVWLAVGRMELSVGRTEEARKFFFRAFSVVPDKGRAAVMLESSRLEEFAGDTKLARAILCKARNESGSDWKVWLESVFLEIRDGEQKRAVNLVKRALQRHTGTGRLWAALVQLYHGDGEHVQCNSLKYALQAVPKSGEVWCEGARIHLNPFVPTFDMDTARRHLCFATKFTPQYGDSFVETLRLQLLIKWITPISDIFLETMIERVNAVTSCSEINDEALYDAIGFCVRECSRVVLTATSSVGCDEDVQDETVALIRSRLTANFVQKAMEDTNLELSCSNADPNYGLLWFHCRHSPTDTARVVLLRARDIISSDLMKSAHIYIAAILRRAGIIAALRNEIENINDARSLKVHAVEALLMDRLRRAPSLECMLREEDRDERTDVVLLESTSPGTDFVTGLIDANKCIPLQSRSVVERRKILFGSDSLVS
mmetsp:Transcript_20983/g.37890  ORF Transcript_20983/g.37890 Transcript_20983/m.37890 type:complete len:1660 (-) Transcript_20983:315-5294(-)